MKTKVGRLVKSLARLRKPLSYEEEKELARHGDVRVRARLAARDDVRPEILYYLAEDPDPAVRRKIAANSVTPRHADLILARDADETVRGDLAEKIARLVPGLSATEQEQLRRMTHEVLTILARDQVPRVRRILAETLKDVADAPPDVIGWLARDTEIDVAGPVLRHSPVLTDEDLIEIIRTCAVAGPIAEISRRANLAPKVTDAVVQSSDVEAITALLANPSAQIREETLDRIVDQAAEIEAWHAPLVRRPKLSPRVALKLAGFVAHSLVEVLQTRADLDEGTVRALKTELTARLEREATGEGSAGKPSGKSAGKRAEKSAEAGRSAETGKLAETVDEALTRARALKAKGALGDEAVGEALARGDRRFVVAALSVLAGEPVALVNKVAESKSGRGVTALCWKAGLGMHLASQLQLRFAHIAPAVAVRAARGDQYPMTAEEMDWQIAFFRTMVPAG
jgi:uncharacterized protein (DUF2336 family)